MDMGRQLGESALQLLMRRRGNVAVRWVSCSARNEDGHFE